MIDSDISEHKHANPYISVGQSSTDTNHWFLGSRCGCELYSIYPINMASLGATASSSIKRWALTYVSSSTCSRVVVVYCAWCIHRQTCTTQLYLGHVGNCRIQCRDATHFKRLIGNVVICLPYVGKHHHIPTNGSLITQQGKHRVVSGARNKKEHLVQRRVTRPCFSVYWYTGWGWWYILRPYTHHPAQNFYTIPYSLAAIRVLCRTQHTHKQSYWIITPPATTTSFVYNRRGSFPSLWPFVQEVVCRIAQQGPCITTGPASPVPSQTLYVQVVYLFQQRIRGTICTGAVAGEKRVRGTAAAFVQAARAVGLAAEEQAQFGTSALIGWVFQTYGVGAVGALAMGKWGGAAEEEEHRGGKDAWSGRVTVHVVCIR